MQNTVKTYSQLQAENLELRKGAEERILSRVIYNTAGAAIWFSFGVMFAAALVAVGVLAIG
jgi:hypothetical protein